MKIAVVVSNLKMGGMERVAVNLADAYFDAGHDTSLFYFKDRKRELSPKNKDIPVHLFNLKNESLKAPLGLIWFIICKVFNAIFSHTFPILFAHQQAKVFSKKLSNIEKVEGKFDLIIFRGQGTFEQIWPINDSRFIFVCENVQKPNYYRWLSKKIYHKLFSNRNVACVSDGALASFNSLVEQFNIQPKRACKISNPNDIDHIKRQAIKTDVTLHPSPYILGLGRLVPQKNFSLLVEAYALLKNSNKISQDLIIVGAGRDQENIQKKAKELSVLDSVFFKGQQSNPYPWFHQADLFVLSSKHEGLGMVLVEALACDTKVVSTDCKGGVRDIMNGFFASFLSEETPESLATTILAALNTPFDENYQKHTQSTLKQFDGQNITDNFISYFR